MNVSGDPSLPLYPPSCAWKGQGRIYLKKTLIRYITEPRLLQQNNINVIFAIHLDWQTVAALGINYSQTDVSLTKISSSLPSTMVSNLLWRFVSACNKSKQVNWPSSFPFYVRRLILCAEGFSDFSEPISSRYNINFISSGSSFRSCIHLPRRWCDGRALCRARYAWELDAHIPCRLECFQTGQRHISTSKPVNVCSGRANKIQPSWCLS